MTGFFSLLISNLNRQGFRKVRQLIARDPSFKLLFVSIFRALAFKALNQSKVPSNHRLKETFDSDSLSEPKILIVAHLHYPEFVSRFLKAIRTFPLSNANFIVTTSNERVVEKINLASSGFANLSVVFAENRGRNFGPLLTLLRSKIQDYDFLIHVHSKKSPHANEKMVRSWTDSQWGFLLENPSLVRRTLRLFHQNRDIAIAYPFVGNHLPPWAFSWLTNIEAAKAWEAKLGFRVSSGPIAYPAGGMFVLRVADFQTLWSFPFSKNDFPDELGQLDGELHHILERYFGVAPLQAGRRHLVYNQVGDYFSTNVSFADSFVREPAEVRHLSNSLTVVSFDFFDTLYRRSVQFPDMAKLVAAEKVCGVTGIRPEDYLEIRNRVEGEARVNLRSGQDLSLIQICELVSPSVGVSGKKLAELEEEAELSLAGARQKQVDLLTYFLSKGVRIAIVTDTYYSEELIRKLAKSIGIPESVDYFVSSELGLRKDTGEMWSFLSNRLLPPESDEHVHIGDNLVSDIQIPTNMGIRCVYVPNASHKWTQLGLGDFEPTPSKMLDPGFRYLASVVSDFGECA